MERATLLRYFNNNEGLTDFYLFIREFRRPLILVQTLELSWNILNYQNLYRYVKARSTWRRFLFCLFVGLFIQCITTPDPLPHVYDPPKIAEKDMVILVKSWLHAFRNIFKIKIPTKEQFFLAIPGQIPKHMFTYFVDQLKKIQEFDKKMVAKR